MGIGSTEPLDGYGEKAGDGQAAIATDLSHKRNFLKERLNTEGATPNQIFVEEIALLQMRLEKLEGAK